MIESHLSESHNIFYELGRILLTFGLIGFGIWAVIKLILHSAKRDRVKRRTGMNG